MKRYDQLAKTYDRQYTEEQNAKIAVALQNTALVGPAVMLDTGCGTGLLFDHFAPQTEEIIAIDASKQLLKEAKKKAKAYNNIALVRADADYVPFPNEAFTTAIALTLLQNMPDPSKTLNEISRVTTQKGIIIVTGLKKLFSLRFFTRLLEKAQLQIAVLETDEKLKDYVVVCSKKR